MGHQTLMHAQYYSGLLLSVVLLTTGCVHTNIEAPGATGRVVDHDTKQPVYGSHVSRVNGGIAIPGSPNDYGHLAVTKTTKDGRFDLPPERFTTVLDIYTGNPDSMWGDFTIAAPGYASRRVEGLAFPRRRWRVDLGQIELEKYNSN